MTKRSLLEYHIFKVKKIWGICCILYWIKIWDIFAIFSFMDSENSGSSRPNAVSISRVTNFEAFTSHPLRAIVRYFYFWPTFQYVLRAKWRWPCKFIFYFHILIVIKFKKENILQLYIVNFFGIRMINHWRGCFYVIIPICNNSGFLQK